MIVDEYRTKRAYAERNALAIAFCKAALLLGWKAGRGVDDAMTDGWGHVVCVDTPNFQVSWHIHPDQVSLLDGLPQYDGEWDGMYTARSIDWVSAMGAILQ